jgi:hypothetical protein
MENQNHLLYMVFMVFIYHHDIYYYQLDINNIHMDDNLDY